MELTVRPSVSSDPHIIAPHLRALDRQEVEVEGVSALEVLEYSYRNTPDPFTVEFADEPVAMFGVVPYGGHPGVGIVWLLGTDALTGSPREFHRLAHEVLPLLAKDYECLFNVVDARYTASLRWLERLGFRSHGEVMNRGFPFVVMALERE